MIPTISPDFLLPLFVFSLHSCFIFNFSLTNKASVNLFLNVTFHIDYLISKDYSHHSRLLGWKPCEFFNFNAGQEATDRTGHETTDWFQIGKGVHQGCILSPCLFNLYTEYIIEMLGWMKHKLESRLLGEISITSDKQMTLPLWHKVKRN